MVTDKSEIDIINQTLAVLNASASVSDRYKAKIDLLEERKERAMQKNYRMGVIGVTSSGKSTIINSLLNEDLLPSAVIPSSSQLVSCRRGDSRCGVVYFEDKKPQNLPSQRLTPQIIKKYGEEQNNPRNREKVKQIEVFTPKFPFDKDLILVDSPGLDAYGFEGHEQLTLNTMLPSVDFCLFITTCKTNSDGKTKSVLNTIAQYDKPVIIIQNMIDSVKPSLNNDGTIRKTEAEVADEHRMRVIKIVDESKIQSKVVILQYSAVWARDGQIRHDKDLLQKSGYNDLVSVIKETFRQLKPKTENKRLVFLKQELEKMISEARKDGAGSLVPMGIFEYEGVIPDLKKEFVKQQNQMADYLETLVDAIPAISLKRDVSEDDIKETQQKCSRCTSNISSVQTSVFATIENLCNRLHLSVTDVFNEQCYFPEINSVPKVHHTTSQWDERIKKKGFVNAIKRGWGWLTGNDDYGYHVIHHKETVVNVQATKESICNYLRSAYTLYSSAISKWVHNVDKAIERLETEIGKLEIEYTNRIERALETKVYLDIADRLESIVSNISVVPVPSETISSSNSNKEHIVKREIPKLSYDISRLSFVVSDKIHRIIFEKTVPQNDNPDNIIIGWDLLCIQNFIRRNLGKDVPGTNNESFTIGKQNYKLFYNLSTTDKIHRSASLYCNVFILISALQHGHALSQLVNSQIKEFIKKSDNLYIVVQDFQEIVNAQVVYEALTSLRIIESKLGFDSKPTFLIMHSNPVYNLAAIETQQKKKLGATIVQNDELTILNSLQKSSFGFLCSTLDSESIISIIKSLK